MPGRAQAWTRRQLIDGIRWRTRAGTPCRGVPARYGTRQTAYGLFRSWQRDAAVERGASSKSLFADQADDLKGAFGLAGGGSQGFGDAGVSGEAWRADGGVAGDRPGQ